jgi:hypothetical protein
MATEKVSCSFPIDSEHETCLLLVIFTCYGTSSFHHLVLSGMHDLSWFVMSSHFSLFCPFPTSVLVNVTCTAQKEKTLCGNLDSPTIWNEVSPFAT